MYITLHKSEIFFGNKFCVKPIYCMAQRKPLFSKNNNTSSQIILSTILLYGVAKQNEHHRISAMWWTLSASTWNIARNSLRVKRKRIWQRTLFYKVLCLSRCSNANVKEVMVCLLCTYGLEFVIYLRIVVLHKKLPSVLSLLQKLIKSVNIFQYMYGWCVISQRKRTGTVLLLKNL